MKQRYEVIKLENGKYGVNDYTSKLTIVFADGTRIPSYLVAAGMTKKEAIAHIEWLIKRDATYLQSRIQGE